MHPLWYDYAPSSLYIYRELRTLLGNLEDAYIICEELKAMPKHHMVQLAHDMPKRSWYDFDFLKKQSINQEIKNLIEHFKKNIHPTAAATLFVGYNDAPDLYFSRFINHGVMFHHLLNRLREQKTKEDVIESLHSESLRLETIDHFFDKLKPKNAVWSIMLEDTMKKKITEDVERTLAEMRLHVKEKMGA